MPDGKPDLSGIWRRNTPGVNYLVNLGAGGAEISMQPWAEALYKTRQENLGKDRPSGTCLPHGLPDAMMVSIGRTWLSESEQSRGTSRDLVRPGSRHQVHRGHLRHERDQPHMIGK
jgi:hypothetical protein